MSEKSNERAVWGRDALITELLNRITKSSRSATLIVGDSGAGKTALLRAIEGKLLEMKETTIVGFHPADRGQDPLLYCLHVSYPT